MKLILLCLIASAAYCQIAPPANLCASSAQVGNTVSTLNNDGKTYSSWTCQQVVPQRTIQPTYYWQLIQPAPVPPVVQPAASLSSQQSVTTGTACPSGTSSPIVSNGGVVYGCPNGSTYSAIGATANAVTNPGTSNANDLPCFTDSTGKVIGECSPVIASQIVNTSFGAAAKQIPHWRTMLGQVRDGIANAKVLFIGDSTTLGIGTTLGSTYPTRGSYPTRLSQLLAVGAITPTSAGYSNQSGVTDDRWTVGSGWIGAGFANGTWEGTGSGNLVYTSGVNADTYQVYYIGNGGLGIITITATGGTPVVVNTGALAAGTYSTTVTAAAASSANTVTITQTGSSYIAGILPTLSSTPQVLVMNAGAPGTQTSYWIGTGNFSITQYVELLAPDLCVISLGINDATNNVAVGTVTANLQTIINYCKVSGDVVLESMPPSAGGTGTLEATYVPAYYALAKTNNIPIIDIFTRFGSAYYAPMMYDGLHPNDYGYWDWAQMLANVLTQ